MVAEEGCQYKCRTKYGRDPTAEDLRNYGPDDIEKAMALVFNQAMSAQKINKALGSTKEERFKKLSLFEGFIFKIMDADCQHLSPEIFSVANQYYVEMKQVIEGNANHDIDYQGSLTTQAKEKVENYDLQYRLKALYPTLSKLLLSDNVTSEQKLPLIEIFKKIAAVPVCYETCSISMKKVAKELRIEPPPSSAQIFTKGKLEELENQTKVVLAEAENPLLAKNTNNELTQKIKNMQQKLKNLPESYNKEIDNFLRESEEIFGEECQKVDYGVTVDYTRLEELNLQGEKLLKKLPDIADLGDLIKEILHIIEKVMGSVSQTMSF